MFILSSLLSVGMFASLSAAGILQHGHSHAHAQSHLHKHLVSNSNSKSNIKSDINSTIAKRGGYQLKDSYTANNFFNEFNFFDGADPTHGFVSYQNQGSAWQRGLINTNDNLIHMGVDSTTFKYDTRPQLPHNIRC